MARSHTPRRPWRRRQILGVALAASLLVVTPGAVWADGDEAIVQEGEPEGDGAIQDDEDAPDADFSPGFAPMSVPPATDDNAVINVNVGGDRTADGRDNIGPLAGVTLRLYNGGSSGPSTPRTESWATCTSDAQGDCSFVVPDTNLAGANRNARFWVVQESAPAGWYTNTELVTGPGNSFTTTQYAFRTGSQLRSGNTYQSGNHFMTYSSSNLATMSSGGIWQSARSNPLIPQTCEAGLDVALILDLSGSIANAGAEQDLRDAGKAFVDALAGSGSTLALYTFASSAPKSTSANGQNYAPMEIDTGNNATTIKNRIQAYTASGGTNWDRGIAQVAEASHNFDLAIVVTDGMPTYFSGSAAGPGSRTRVNEVEQAIFSANQLKARNTRVLAVGVGDGVTGDPANLRAISGVTPYTPGGTAANADYFQENWNALKTVLENIARGATCQASIEVEKLTQVDDASTPNPGGAGWTFDLESTNGVFGSTGTPQAQLTTGSTSGVEDIIKFTSLDATATVTLSELLSPSQQSQGWALDSIACTVNGQKLSPTSPTASFSIGVGDDVDCVVLNKKTSPASLIVHKKWNVNGTAIDHGSQPEGLTATLQVGGAAEAWSQNITSFSAGNEVTISESTGVDDEKLPLCTITSQKISGDGVAATDLGSGYTATLNAGENVYTITNTVECTQKLTLKKIVDNTFGDADQYDASNLNPGDWSLDPTAWTFTASGADEEYSFTHDESKSVAVGTYALAESDKPGYTQTGLVCDSADFQSGSANVSVGLGQEVTCIFTNKILPGSVEWLKVGPDGEDPLSGSEWSLQGPSGDPMPIVDGTVPGSFSVIGLEWGDYILTETKAPAGHKLLSDPITFTVGPGDDLDLVLDAVVNEQRDVPDLPLTGGIGRDHIYIAGVLVGLLGMAAYVFTNRRRQA